MVVVAAAAEPAIINQNVIRQFFTVIYLDGAYFIHIILLSLLLPLLIVISSLSVTDEGSNNQSLVV